MHERICRPVRPAPQCFCSQAGGCVWAAGSARESRPRWRISRAATLKAPPWDGSGYGETTLSRSDVVSGPEKDPGGFPAPGSLGDNPTSREVDGTSGADGEPGTRKRPTRWGPRSCQLRQRHGLNLSPTPSTSSVSVYGVGDRFVKVNGVAGMVGGIADRCGWRGSVVQLAEKRDLVPGRITWR
jgi:hypothetical protein